MSPPSGSLLGKQTQQLPGLEKNAHYFNYWSTHQPDNFTAMPMTHYEGSELVLHNCILHSELRPCDEWKLSPLENSGLTAQFWEKGKF